MRRKSTTSKIPNRSQSRSQSRSGHNQLRIIGGEWRGRKLDFPDAQGLRPTPDRVRETLFNWLMPVMRGARCLDLFAGSGALGLEALSRGAAEVVLVDSQAQVVAGLEKNIKLLQADTRVQLHPRDASAYLNQLNDSFDVIFLDPPYHQNWLQPCIDSLYEHRVLNQQGYLYFEASRDENLPELPVAWMIHRQKTAGQVGYYLVREVEQR